MLFYILITILALNAAIPRIKNIRAAIKENDKGIIKGESFFLLLTIGIWVAIIILNPTR
jgi:hypothetical protein